MAQSKSSIEPPAKTPNGRAGWGRSPGAIIATLSLLVLIGAALIVLAVRQPDVAIPGSQPGGQTKADQQAAATFDAPEPQPKQPSATDVARSSTPVPTPTVPRSAGATQPSRDTPDAPPAKAAGARQPTTVGTTTVTGEISSPGR